MSSDGSVTYWLELFKAGDSAAARPIWERYFERLVRVARKKLKGVPRRAADEEDVALSAFARFCHVVEQGRFERLDNRDDLWQLLVLITAGKANDFIKHANRKKRGGGAVLDEAQLSPADSFAESRGLERVLSDEPTPEFLVEMADQCRRLLGCLDDGLREVALAKMNGLTNREIAAQLGCLERSVERKLKSIRRLWSAEVAHDSQRSCELSRRDARAGPVFERGL
jgi:DNA-directed RNA polymerase specialized sigma24 family protein